MYSLDPPKADTTQKMIALQRYLRDCFQGLLALRIESGLPDSRTKRSSTHQRVAFESGINKRIVPSCLLSRKTPGKISPLGLSPKITRLASCGIGSAAIDDDAGDGRVAAAAADR